MIGDEHESCPSCGSQKTALQGRVRDGRAIRELVCLTCKHVWPVEQKHPSPPAVDDVSVPSATAES